MVAGYSATTGASRRFSSGSAGSDLLSKWEKAYSSSIYANFSSSAAFASSDFGSVTSSDFDSVTSFLTGNSSSVPVVIVFGAARIVGYSLVLATFGDSFFSSSLVGAAFCSCF